MLPHENAFVCALLAWIHGKSKKGCIPEFGILDDGNIDLTNGSSNGSAIAYVYSLLLRQFPGASVSLRCSFQLLYQRDPPQCDVYFGARAGDHGIYFACHLVHSPVTKEQVVGERGREREREGRKFISYTLGSQRSFPHRDQSNIDENAASRSAVKYRRRNINITEFPYPGASQGVLWDFTDSCDPLQSGPYNRRVALALLGV